MKMAIRLHRSLRVTGLKNELFTVIYRVKVLFFHIFKWILEKIRKRREAVFSQNDKIYKKVENFRDTIFRYLKNEIKDG
jgi:cell shape-determining protein MreC